ncbi:AzlC family ABC transporter permease [Actinoplanes xinjiangensis]|uniref:AzlC family ABC transporter permease n=1 Tax=Actinoplanes xinjiangensis TaxID=512350 RepID=UPI003418BA69
MGTLYRTRAQLRDIGALAAASLAVGASFGAIAIAYGLPAWVPVVMSVLIFAGGAQFLAIGLLAAGNPLAAVLAGLLLNARHLPFGLAVADTIGTRWRDRLVGSHLMTDETVAFALAESDPAARRRVYWLVGGSLFIAWNTGVLLGVLLGGATGDPDALGLDAAFPAGLIALILPSLRDRETRLVALTGAVLAVLLTPVLPAGLPVMCALLGLLVLLRPTTRHHPTPTAPVPDPTADSGPTASSSEPTASSSEPAASSSEPTADSGPAASSSEPAAGNRPTAAPESAAVAPACAPTTSADGDVSEGERC